MKTKQKQTQVYRFEIVSFDVLPPAQSVQWDKNNYWIKRAVCHWHWYVPAILWRWHSCWFRWCAADQWCRPPRPSTRLPQKGSARGLSHLEHHPYGKNTGHREPRPQPIQSWPRPETKNSERKLFLVAILRFTPKWTGSQETRFGQRVSKYCNLQREKKSKTVLYLRLER